MQEGSKGIDLEQYSANSEWDMVDSTATVEEESEEASVIFTLKIKRKPRYMVLSVILPIVMLSVLNLFVFVLPCDSGEKASYAITVFLAFAVFLTIISSELPRNSESLSIFSVYIIILTIQSTLITMAALFLLRIRQFETSVPKPVSWLTDVISCKCCRRRDIVIVSTQESNNNPSTEKLPRVNGFLAKRVSPQKVEKPESKASFEENCTQETCDWKRVANALDRLFFCMFTIITLTSSLVCLVYASHAA